MSSSGTSWKERLIYSSCILVLHWYLSDPYTVQYHSKHTTNWYFEHIVYPKKWAVFIFGHNFALTLEERIRSLLRFYS